MQPARSRLICRSSNPFIPSLAWWQHSQCCVRQPLRSQPQRPSSSLTTDVKPTESDPVEPIPHKLVKPLEDAQPAGVFPRASANTLSKATRQIKPRHSEQSNPQQFTLRTVKTNKTMVAKDEQGNLLPYEGRAFGFFKPPKEDVLTIKSLPYVVGIAEYRSLSPIERLNREIGIFSSVMQPDPSEALARKDAIERVIKNVNKILPKAELELFGSERTGLALALSDIDLRIVPKGYSKKKSERPPPFNKRKELNNYLIPLNKALQRSKQYREAELRHARYPLVAFKDVSTGLGIQIVSCNDTSNQRAMIEKYCHEFSYLRQLFPLIQSMLKVRNMTDVFRGGFGSYSLLMMTVAALRQLPPKEPILVDGLFSFLEFWSTFDTEKHGISIEPNELFEKGSRPVMSMKTEAKLQEPDARSPPTWLLSLQDPADATNDLGRKALIIKHFQRTCAVVLQALKEKSIESNAINSIFPVVGYIFHRQKLRRDRLRSVGLAISGSGNKIKKVLLDDDVGHKTPTLTKGKVQYRYRFAGASDEAGPGHQQKV